MCGRTRVTESSLSSAANYARKERASIPEECKTNVNCCPGSGHVIIGKNREMKTAVWGLITPWDKKLNHFALFNGRSETWQELPSFKNTKRGVIFIDGFYEWKGENKTGKQPYYIYLKTGKPMMIAVAYNFCSVLNKNTFSILTRASYGLMQSIHTRQPVLLSEEAAEIWLNGSNEAVKALVASNKSFEVLEKEGKWHPVTSKIGKPSYKGEDCSLEIDTSVGKIRSFFSPTKNGPPSSSSSSSAEAVAGRQEGGTAGASTLSGSARSPSRSPTKKKAVGITGPMAKFLVQQHSPGKRGREDSPKKEQEDEEEEEVRAAKEARTSSTEIIDLT